MSIELIHRAYLYLTIGHEGLGFTGSLSTIPTVWRTVSCCAVVNEPPVSESNHCYLKNFAFCCGK